MEITTTSSYEPVITNLDQVETAESANPALLSLLKIQPVEKENIFHNDPGLWESITEDLRRHWIDKGSNSRHIDADFTKSIRVYPK